MAALSDLPDLRADVIVDRYPAMPPDPPEALGAADQGREAC
jgi:hypothetical protein